MLDIFGLMASTRADYLSFPLCSPSKNQLHSPASGYVLKHIQNGDIFVKKKRINTKPALTCSRVLTPRQRSSGSRPQMNVPVSSCNSTPNHCTTLLATGSDSLNFHQTSSAENKQTIAPVPAASFNDCTSSTVRKPCQQQNFNHDVSPTDDLSSDSPLEFAACSDCSKACARSLDYWMDHLADKHPVPIKWPSSRAVDLHGDQQAFPYSSVVGSHKKRKVDIVPRPLNSFMVFAQYLRRVILYSFPDAHNVHISQRVGQLWRRLSEELRDQYAAEASRLQRLHSMEFPNYKYQPRKRTTIRPGQETDEVDSPQDASPLINVGDQTASQWDSPVIRMDSVGSTGTCFCASVWGNADGETTEPVNREGKPENENLDSAEGPPKVRNNPGTIISLIDHCGGDIGAQTDGATSAIGEVKPAVSLICTQAVPTNHRVLMPATLISMRWPAPIPTEVIDQLNVTNQSDAPLTFLVSGPDATHTPVSDEEVTTVLYGHHNVVQVLPSPDSRTSKFSNNQSEVSANSGTLEDLLNSPSMFTANPPQSKFIILEPLKVSIRNPVISLPTAYPGCHYVVAANDCGLSTETSWSTKCSDSGETLCSTPSMSSASPDSVVLDGYTVLQQPPSSFRSVQEIGKGDLPDVKIVERPTTTVALENLSRRMKSHQPLAVVKIEEHPLATQPSDGLSLSNVAPAVPQPDLPSQPSADRSSLVQVKYGSAVELGPTDCIGFDDIDTCGPSPSLEELSQLTLFNTKFSELGTLTVLTERSASAQALPASSASQSKHEAVPNSVTPQSSTSDLIPSTSASLPSIESWTFGGSN